MSMFPPAEPVGAADSTTSNSDAQIYDRGYRHYEGAREGRAHAIRALIGYSIKRGLGIKKRWTAKIIPILLYSFAFFPVIVIIGIRAFAGDLAAGFNYQTLYDLLATILLVFAAATAPEMLCDDRRQHVLPLYFSRAISRADYLLAKIGALGILMSTIALIPGLILFLGLTFLADSPVRYFLNHISDIGRVVANGLLLSLFFAAIGILIASFTDRKSVAAAVYIGTVVLVSGFVAALFEAIKSSWHRYLALLSPTVVPQALTSWIFGTHLGGDNVAARANLAGPWYLLSIALVVGVSSFVVYRQYLRGE
jgi:ABC-2 type transport system permease protein